MKKGRFLLPLLFCICLTTSCVPLVYFGVGTAAGIGGYMYFKAPLMVIYQAPFVETWDATLKALEKRELKIKTKKHDLTSGKIEARRVDDESIIVTLKYKSARETVATIRVGAFGNEKTANIIKDQIGKELFK